MCSFVDVPLAEALATSGDRRLVTIAADVRDPGNAGTLVRTSDALGVQAVVLAGQSVDLHNPKTVRASVGSVFRLPVALAPDPVVAIASAREAGLLVLAADGEGELSLDDAGSILAGPVAWLFGNEAWGLPPDLAAVGRPSRAHSDRGPGGEPEPLDRGGDLPARDRAGATDGVPLALPQVAAGVGSAAGRSRSVVRAWWCSCPSWRRSSKTWP